MDGVSAAEQDFAKDNVTRFGRLGGELDNATLALKRIQDYVNAVKKNGPEAAKELISVKIEKATFVDGSAYLQEDLTRLLPEYLGEMLDRALADRLAEHGRKVDELKAAMGLEEPSQQAPRGRGDGRQGTRS